jgi:hypothetical protein
MTDEPAPEDSEWHWVTQGDLRVGGCLTFARGISPEQMIRAFGMDPGAALMLSEVEAVGANPAGGPPWIRVGQTGEWAFAVEQLSLIGALEGAGQRLSLGTEAVVVDWTAQPTYEISYMRDGVFVTRFEPGMEWARSGREPDRFLREMRQLGFRVDRPEPQRSGPRRDLDAERRERRKDRVVTALEMLTLALGIRLPEHVALGPLLTVRRRSAD